MVSVQANDNSLCEGGYPGDLCIADKYQIFRIIMLILWFIVMILTVVIASVLFRNYSFHWWTPKKLIFSFAFMLSFDRTLGFFLGVCGVKELTLYEVIFAFGQCFSFSCYSILVVVWSELFTRVKKLDNTKFSSTKLRITFIFINLLVYVLLVFGRLFQYVIPVPKVAKNLVPVLAFVVIVVHGVLVAVQGFRLLRELRKIREISIRDQQRLAHMTFLVCAISFLSIALPIIFVLARLVAQEQMFWLYMLRGVELFAWAIIGFGLINEQHKNPHFSFSGSPIDLPERKRVSKSESLSVLPSPTDSYAESAENVSTPFDSVPSMSLQNSSSNNTV